MMIKSYHKRLEYHLNSSPSVLTAVVGLSLAFCYTVMVMFLIFPVISFFIPPYLHLI